MLHKAIQKINQTREVRKSTSQQHSHFALHRGPEESSSDPYSYRRKLCFPRCSGVGYIAKQKYARIFGIASLSILIILLTLAACPVVLTDPSAEAAVAPVASTTSLDMTTGYVSAGVNIVLTSANGNFAKSADADKAKFGVKTNNYTGYTLQVVGPDDNGLLANTDTSITTANTLSSITTPITEAVFDTTTYNNKWGMIPNKYVIKSGSSSVVIDNTVSQNFLPAPTTAGTTLNITDEPNKTSQDTYSTDITELVMDDYEIGLGARVDYTRAASNYKNTFQLVAVANPVAFAISFDQTTGDVSNMPSPLAPTSTTGAITSITLPNTTPVRPGYTFKSWCEGTVGGTTANPATTCTGTEYSTGTTYYLDQTIQNITILYAVWTPNTQNISFSLGTGVTSVKVCTIAGDCQGTNLKGTATSSAPTVSGLSYNNTYYFYPTFQNATTTTAGEYYFGSWGTGAGSVGILNSVTTENTTFTIGQGNGVITLTATPTTFADVFSGKIKIGKYYRMQDMDNSAESKMCDRVANGQTDTLIDARDNKTYAVAKINGTCWMTDNLRLGYDENNAADPDDPTNDGVSSLTLEPETSNVSVTRTLTTYDLVKRGPNTSGKNQCYGAWNDSVQAGWGPAYENSCIHSGVTEHSGGMTVWYNYTLATAGTIIDKNTTSANPATNTNPATESICPKGWTLPSKTQIDNQRNVSSFFPVLGGGYRNGALDNEAMRGYWWGSEAYGGGKRYYLGYNDSSSLYADNFYRSYGRYVRCVQASS